jgi:ABC-2 type transport system permease protein
VGVDPSLAGRIDRQTDLREFIVGREGGKAGQKSSSAQEAIVPMVLSILLLMGVMQSAGLLLTSTIEEKSNRVVEVLVSSVSAFELLAGKVIGAWLTGLVMILAWGGAGAYTAGHFGFLKAETMSTANLAWFIYFFLGGYLLFGSLYAAIGAMCNSIQDAQNMMFPIVLLIMLPMLALGFVLNHPDSPVSVGLTWFPFSAPMIATLRLALSPPAPQWQIAVAAVIVAVSAVFLLWLGGKIFRTAILMTGKPPRPSEVLRMLREA